jgi:GNAT superfamily N-acetyltransferase
MRRATRNNRRNRTREHDEKKAKRGTSLVVGNAATNFPILTIDALTPMRSSAMLIENPNPSELQLLLPALMPGENQAEKQKTEFLLDASPNAPVPWSHSPAYCVSDLLSGLFVARLREAAPPIAAVWVHPAPGGTTLLGKPVQLQPSHCGWEIAPQAPNLQLQTELVARAIQWSDAMNSEMLQAVVEPTEVDFATALRNCHVQKLVDLLYLSSPVLTESATHPCASLTAQTAQPSVLGDLPSPHFETVPPAPGNLERWYRLLAATYEQSRDCPAMNGRRSLANTVAGYRATGTFWADGWVILRDHGLPEPSSRSGLTVLDCPEPDGGMDQGAMILADHPAGDFVELVYFGLAPQARGKGWGQQILQEAHRLTQKIGRARIIAAVDRQNLPALRVYAAADYTALEERAVFARFFPVSNQSFDRPPILR